MTDQEVERLTKYFSEGVKAGIASSRKPVNWFISVERAGGHLYFLNLDPLKRRVQFLKTSIEEGSEDLRLMSEKYEYPEHEIAFVDASSAWACIEALKQAVDYIQSHPDNHPYWHDVPSDLFQQPKVMSC